MIDAFALKAITLIQDCGSQSIEAVGRTKMPDGQHVAWQINLGLEDEPEDREEVADDEVALVAQFAKPMSKKLN